MSKQIDILRLLTDEKKLKRISFDELYDIENKYPYCSNVNVLINRKQLKANGSLSLLQMVDLVSKTDNPGLAFTYVIEGWSEYKSKDDLPKKKKRKKVADISKKSKKKAKKKRSVKKEKVKLSSGIASEKLAEIYLKQGMRKEAIEMYKSLSLQNPKKSAYFAKILKKIKKQ